MSTLTPNMGLIEPAVGSELGPAWASELNSSLTTIDQHNHAMGNGVQINPSGININADLPFNQNNATILRTTRFFPQASIIASSAPDQGCVYAFTSSSTTRTELYYNDYNGNQVQITNNGNVNSGAGSISGLPFSGAASYSAGTYTWEAGTSGAPTPGTMASGGLEISPSTAFTYYTGIACNASISASYTFTLPTGVAVDNGSMLTSDTSGNLSYTTTDITAGSGTTMSLSGGVLSVGTIQTANIAAGAVTNAKLAALNYEISTAGGSTTSLTFANITNLTTTLTTSGRPVMLFLQPTSSTSLSGQVVVTWASTSSSVNVKLLRGATTVAYWNFQQNPTTITKQLIGTDFVIMDTPTAGTYTYQVQAVVGTSGDEIFFNNVQLVAYEIS